MADIDVSVVIPTYRRERQVVEAVESALAQRTVSLEVIVLDDTPEGSARTAVTSVTDPRVRYLQCAEPSGGRPALVRNAGARLARGRFLHFLDDDDLLQPDTLAVLSEALDASPRAGMAFGVTVPFGEDPADLLQQQGHFRRAAHIAQRLRSRMELVANLNFHPTILVNSACMARRETFAAVGGYDAEVPVCEDVDLWARIVRATGFVFVDRPVMRYRTGAPSLMHDLKDVEDERMVSAYRRIYEKYRAAHGRGEFYLLKLWARTLLR